MVLVIVLLCASALNLSAAGFRVSAQAARPMAMGDAFAAQADDPSALAYNPAGIAFLKGYQAQLGITTIIVPQTDFTGTTRLSSPDRVHEKAKSDLFIVPTLYLTGSISSLPLSFGLGINSFYPLAKRWDTNSSFRDNIIELSVKPINFQPTVAWRFDDLKLSVAAGLDITYGQVSLQKMAYTQLPAQLGGVYAELGSLGVDGSAVGFGYNLGLLWKPRTDLSLGVSYRSSIHLGLTGDANYLATTAIGQNPALGLASRVNTGAASDLTLPDHLLLGIAWKPVEQLTLEFDLERIGWSSYDKLEIRFGEGLTPFNNKPDPKNWQDVWSYRFGLQYALTPRIGLRAGYAFETNPVPDATLGPELPDADRHNLSFGIGLHNELGSLDLGYVWVHSADRTVSNPMESGTFKSDAHLIAASLTCRF